MENSVTKSVTDGHLLMKGQLAGALPNNFFYQSIRL